MEQTRRRIVATRVVILAALVAASIGLVTAPAAAAPNPVLLMNVLSTDGSGYFTGDIDVCLGYGAGVYDDGFETTINVCSPTFVDGGVGNFDVGPGEQVFDELADLLTTSRPTDGDGYFCVEESIGYRSCAPPSNFDAAGFPASAHVAFIRFAITKSSIDGPDYDTAWSVQVWGSALSDQSISYSTVAPTDAVVGGAVYEPSATATSGLPVDITVDHASDGVCEIAGGVVTFTGVGSCTLDADQPGDDAYAAAIQVVQTFPVGQPTPPPPPPKQADLSLRVSCAAKVQQGKLTTCSVTVRNLGPMAAKRVVTTLTLPARATAVTVAKGRVRNGSAVWATPWIGPHASKTFTVTYRVTAACRVDLFGAVLALTPDPMLTNNAVVVSQIVTR